VVVADPNKFTELVKYHAAIQSELPEVLAELAAHGQEAEALELLVAWGTHSKANSEVWQEARNLLQTQST
jgi:hypothetical protein